MHEWAALAAPPRPDNRVHVRAGHARLTLVLWPSRASHQRQPTSLRAAGTAAFTGRPGMGGWAIPSALRPCVPQMPHCEDIKARDPVTVGVMLVALAGLGPLGLPGMIGPQVFCQHPCSAQTLQHGLPDE